jgi:hypothetical protein
VYDYGWLTAWISRRNPSLPLSTSAHPSHVSCQCPLGPTATQRHPKSVATIRSDPSASVRIQPRLWEVNHRCNNSSSFRGLAPIPFFDSEAQVRNRSQLSQPVSVLYACDRPVVVQVGLLRYLAPLSLPNITTGVYDFNHLIVRRLIR